MIKLLSGSIMCIFLLITSLAHSADYPDHPVNILTMTKPGAQIDLLTRALAEQLKKTWNLSWYQIKRVVRTGALWPVS